MLPSTSEEQGIRSADGGSPTTTEPSTYLGALKSLKSSPAVALTLNNSTPPRLDSCSAFMEDALSSVTDRVDTQSNFTHHDMESVVSSWIDDDDCFFQSAMQDNRGGQGQQQPTTEVRMPQGKGWKVASSSGNGAGRPPRRPRKANQPSSGNAGSNNGPAQSVSGGRFDALASDTKRRW